MNRRDIDGGLWEALVDGRLGFLPREDGAGQRHYVVVENPRLAREQARFTAREAGVLRLAACGFTGKGICHALGLSAPAVSEALARAAAKTGLGSRVELVRAAAVCFADAARVVSLDALSAAEREVLALLCRGLSNAEIARLRESSSRTVANQVASILRKTGSHSRRALSAQTAARLGRFSEEHSLQSP